MTPCILLAYVVERIKDRKELTDCSCEVHLQRSTYHIGVAGMIMSEAPEARMELPLPALIHLTGPVPCFTMEVIHYAPRRRL